MKYISWKTYRASYTHKFTEQFGVMKLPETYIWVVPTWLSHSLVVLTCFFVLHPTLLVNTRIAPKFGHGHFLQNATIHPLFYHSTLFAATTLQINERMNSLIHD